MDSTVENLRNYRDNYLTGCPAGERIISCYYAISPAIADFIDGHPVVKPAVRTALMPAMAISSSALNTPLPVKIAIALALVTFTAAILAGLQKRIRFKQKF
jgi:hypothetical protein